jgi:hypothetical protein
MEFWFAVGVKVAVAMLLFPIELIARIRTFCAIPFAKSVKDNANVKELCNVQLDE